MRLTSETFVGYRELRDLLLLKVPDDKYVRFSQKRPLMNEILMKTHIFRSAVFQEIDHLRYRLIDIE